MDSGDERRENVEKKAKNKERKKKKSKTERPTKKKESIDEEIMTKTHTTDVEGAFKDTIVKKVAVWVTREMAETMEREYILLTTLKELVFYLIFGILATIVCLGMSEQSMYHMFKMIEELLYIKNDFGRVYSASLFWEFIMQFFDNSFYWDYWYYPDIQAYPTSSQDRNLFYENYLLGVPRLRQLRVRENTCSIHEYFKRIFLNCYGRYSHSNQDTLPFGLGNGTAWTYNSAAETGSSDYWGEIDWYHGGGYYQDLSLSRATTINIITFLQNNLWITRATRAIFLEYAVYNANLNLFAVVRTCFEFPATGGIVSSNKIHVVKLLRYSYPYDFFILGCELILLAYFVFYTIEEIREFIYFKKDYWKKFWTYIDIFILLLGYTATVLAMIRTIMVDRKIKRLVQDPNTFSALDMLSTFQKFYQNLLAIQLFFIYLKIFKFLNFNKNMAQLNNTLSKCRKDMLGFALMFFVIFIAFAVLGYLIFGTEVKDFSNFYLAMFTLLRTILGDFEYTDIEKANRILAPIFFLCFIFLVFFVLLNMFLAIINDTYTDVKTEIAMSPEEMQMGGFLRRGYYNIMLALGLKNFFKPEKLEKNEYEMTAGEIRTALRHIGFSDMEIEMFFARYNIDPNAAVRDYDINKLMDALEGKIDPTPPKMEKVKKDLERDKPMVAIDDFISQQERLDEIEGSINKATSALTNLLDRLETLESVRKVKHGH